MLIGVYANPTNLLIHFLVFPSPFMSFQPLTIPIGLLPSLFGLPWPICFFLATDYFCGPVDHYSYHSGLLVFALLFSLPIFFILLGFFCHWAPLLKVGINIQPPEHMNCSYNSYASTKRYSFLSFFGWFFEQWAPTYFLSCHEQGCPFEFPNLTAILKHNFCFINTMLLLTANPLQPFTSLLLSLALGLFPFPSFSQNLSSFFLFIVPSFPKLHYLSSPFKQPIMSPAEDEGSFCCKGKEVAVENPTAKTMGEETPLSELDRSKEEEEGRDPNSECPPLIDLWYDTHIHFPVVPGDYLPSSSDHVWLSICRRDIEVS